MGNTVSRRFVVSLLGLGSLHGSNSATARVGPAIRPFRFFDSSGLKDIPASIYNLGLVRLPILYEAAFIAPNQSRNDFEKNGPDERHIKELARHHRSVERLVIDVECWKIHGQWARRHSGRANSRSISFYRRLLAAWKEANPDTRIGLYGLLASNMDAIQFLRRGMAEAYAQFERTKVGITALVDDLYPSGYWLYDNPFAYQAAVAAQVEVAKEIHRRPAYFFTWHRGSGGHYQYHWLDSLTYRFILSTVERHADGLVVWAMSDEKSDRYRFKAKSPSPYAAYHPPTDGHSTDFLIRLAVNSGLSDPMGRLNQREIQWLYELIECLQRNRTRNPAIP